MGVQENEDESVNLLEVQHEVTEEEPIEQVFSQEVEDISTVEQSIESEDQERFEETARIEEDIAAPQVEPKPQLKKARKVTRKSPTKSENEGKPISKLQTELRKHSDAQKKTDFGDHKHSKRTKRFVISTPLNYQRSSKTNGTEWVERFPHLKNSENLQK